MRSQTVLIEELQLSPRTYSALRRNHINSVDQLYEALQYGVRKLKGLGPWAAKEAEDKFIAYALSSGKEQDTSAETDASGMIAPGYRVEEAFIVAPDGRRIGYATLEEIGLSGRACSRLRRNGIPSVFLLIGMKAEDLRKMPSIGKKLVVDIKETVENWLSDHNGDDK